MSTNSNAYINLVTQVDIDLATVDADGILDDATGAGPFVTFLADTPPDGLAHRLNLTSAANLSGIDFTIVGTDADDREQTEVITGPNATTVETTKYFKTWVSITPDATLGANTMDVGWVDEIASSLIYLDSSRSSPAAVSVNHTGTANWTIQTTSQNVRITGDGPFEITDQNSIFWFDDANFTGKSADTHNDLALKGRTAMRVLLNSYSAGAELQVFVTYPA